MLSIGGVSIMRVWRDCIANLKWDVGVFWAFNFHNVLEVKKEKNKPSILGQESW